MKMRRKPSATKCENGGGSGEDDFENSKRLNERGDWNENPLKNEENTKIEMELELTLE
ncbi:hypothetical protein A2U01_0026094 [Trifolium medium]|uniref:Uncharacterized protein n=1 Tax=Trifolium medium TaxID=97028 RepID=A0A392P2K6_9FABA|nr:hypothetical protein [Trifolium medium]